MDLEFDLNIRKVDPNTTITTAFDFFGAQSTQAFKVSSSVGDFYAFKVLKENLSLTKLKQVKLISSELSDVFIPFRDILLIDDQYFLCFDQIGENLTFLEGKTLDYSTQLTILRQVLKIILYLYHLKESFLVMDPRLIFVSLQQDSSEVEVFYLYDCIILLYR